MSSKHPLIISMDFNMNPFCLIFSNVFRRGDQIVTNIFDSWSIKEGSIPEIVEKLKSHPVYSRRLSNCYITGDFSGTAGNISVKGNKSNFEQLKNQLGLAKSQVVLTPNMRHADSRALCNYMMYMKDTFILNISPSNCGDVIRDMQTVEYNEEQKKIIKADRSKQEQHSDLLDAFRYLVHNFLRKDILLHQKYGRV